MCSEGLCHISRVLCVSIWALHIWEHLRDSQLISLLLHIWLWCCGGGGGVLLLSLLSNHCQLALLSTPGTRNTHCCAWLLAFARFSCIARKFLQQHYALFHLTYVRFSMLTHTITSCLQ